MGLEIFCWHFRESIEAKLMWQGPAELSDDVLETPARHEWEGNF
jgi:hypothetical protein